MAQPANLITVADFAPYRALNLNQVQARVLDPFIAEAQEFDLKPLLGSAFYKDIVDNIGDTKYQELLKGKTYTNDRDETVEFQGLTAALVYYTYARYVENKPIVDTKHGVVRKKTNFSEPVDDKTLARKVGQARSGGVSYWRDVEDFLNINANRTVYPLWKGCDTDHPTGSIRISNASELHYGHHRHRHRCRHCNRDHNRCVC